jgi:hypothetical protein
VKFDRLLLHVGRAQGGCIEFLLLHEGRSENRSCSQSNRYNGRSDHDFDEAISFAAHGVL